MGEGDFLGFFAGEGERGRVVEEMGGVGGYPGRGGCSSMDEQGFGDATHRRTFPAERTDVLISTIASEGTARERSVTEGWRFGEDENDGTTASARCVCGGKRESTHPTILFLAFTHDGCGEKERGR